MSVPCAVSWLRATSVVLPSRPPPRPSPNGGRGRALQSDVVRAHRHPRERPAAGRPYGGHDGRRRGDGWRLPDALQPLRRVGTAQLEHVQADRRHVPGGGEPVVGEGRVAHGPPAHLHPPPPPHPPPLPPATPTL